MPVASLDHHFYHYNPQPKLPNLSTCVYKHAHNHRVGKWVVLHSRALKISFVLVFSERLRSYIPFQAKITPRKALSFRETSQNPEPQNLAVEHIPQKPLYRNPMCNHASPFLAPLSNPSLRRSSMLWPICLGSAQGLQSRYCEKL